MDLRDTSICRLTFLLLCKLTAVSHPTNLHGRPIGWLPAIRCKRECSSNEFFAIGQMRLGTSLVPCRDMIPTAR